MHLTLNQKIRSEVDAKRFAAGPGGEIMAKHPLQYCKAMSLGEHPRKGYATKVFNSTATFLALPSGTYAVTCAHVVDAYRDVESQFGSVLLQIGMTEIDLSSQLVCKNDKVDLATIRLTQAQVDSLLTQGEIGSRVIQPAKWPPNPISEGDAVLFGGFPGAWRERPGFDELVFGTFSAAGIRVSSSHKDRFTCQLDREHWVDSLSGGESGRSIHLRDLGGLSGGPAFVDRALHFEFAGLIYEYSAEYDIVFLRPAGLIQEDGSITDVLA
ncbi:hypothetical protein BH11PSE7_BH11PSE7_31390 [soil metagenome]